MNAKTDSRAVPEALLQRLSDYLTARGGLHFAKRSWKELKQKMTAARPKTEKRLRFWSAGCSTGEEPFSLAILLDKLIPDLKDWNVTILATDINTGAIRKAEEGTYSDWSFRDNPPWFKEHYFEKVDGSHHRLLPRIRKIVTFWYLHLSEDHYPALQNNTNAMDFIFCRNVLMDFAPD